MHNIDNLDQQILRVLTKDARTPYAEMAKNFGVSPGTIHVRVEKMRQSGIIEGTKVKINERKLGYDVCGFIGIILKSAKDYDKVIKKLEAIDEVVEAFLHLLDVVSKSLLTPVVDIRHSAVEAGDVALRLLQRSCLLLFLELSVQNKRQFVFVHFALPPFGLRPPVTSGSKDIMSR